MKTKWIMVLVLALLGLGALGVLADTSATLVIQDGANLVSLTNGATVWGDRDYVWSEVPDILAGKNFTKYQNAHKRDIRAKALTAGKVVLAITERWDEGRDDQARLIRDGWTKQGTSLKTSDGTDWRIWTKDCPEGDIIHYQTEKYIAPIVIFLE